MELERPWGSLHYRDEGGGPLVVLLHPFAQSGALWLRLVEELRPARPGRDAGCPRPRREAPGHDAGLTS